MSSLKRLELPRCRPEPHIPPLKLSDKMLLLIWLVNQYNFSVDLISRISKAHSVWVDTFCVYSFVCELSRYRQAVLRHDEVRILLVTRRQRSFTSFEDMGDWIFRFE